SDHYLMGYIRFAHFAAGYILAVGILGRLYWAFAGNEHAKELFFPSFSKKSMLGAWHEILWYSFLVKEPKKCVGHNPLATYAMFFMFVLGAFFMIVTGFALYGEGTGMGSWQFELFSAWVIPLFGQSQDVHTFHHLGMWLIILFVIVHVYVAIREDFMSRQSMVSTMISGWRMFKDNRP
ncbi:Ni/Fe-hydrogenase, b-type cytochrome subunit, partial [Mariprofundus ferrooxydans]|nr:Ni/Fe-hydrogenase, b-type cytochrome subunit [Mariprofundus ferrooxydans]